MCECVYVCVCVCLGVFPCMWVCFMKITKVVCINVFIILQVKCHFKQIITADNSEQPEQIEINQNHIICKYSCL